MAGTTLKGWSKRAPRVVDFPHAEGVHTPSMTVEELQAKLDHIDSPEFKALPLKEQLHYQTSSFVCDADGDEFDNLTPDRLAKDFLPSEIQELVAAAIRAHGHLGNSAASQPN